MALQVCATTKISITKCKGESKKVEVYYYVAPNDSFFPWTEGSTILKKKTLMFPTIDEPKEVCFMIQQSQRQRFSILLSFYEHSLLLYVHSLLLYEHSLLL